MSLFKKKDKGKSTRRESGDPTDSAQKNEVSAVKPPKIFGDGAATFDILLKYEREKYPDAKIEVPLVISRCLDFLMYKGLNAEGLFRVPGNKETLELYIQEFNEGRGDSINFLKRDEQPENVASLLKQYLREMPDRPLFTKELDPQFCALMEMADETERVSKYWELIQQIPEVNQQVVQKLLFYLMQVAANASTNKMGANALSIVFGQMAGVFAEKGYELVNWLIEKFPLVYEKTALEQADKVVFLRKLVGHHRSVIKLIQEGNFVFSFDSSGNVRIWDSVSCQYYKSFETHIKHPAKPIILHKKIYLIDQSAQTLKSWTLESVLDLNQVDPICEVVKLELGCPTFFEAVGDTIWIGGEKILLIKEDGTTTSLGEPDHRTLYTFFTVFGDKVLALKGKTMQIWDIGSTQMIQEVNCFNGTPQDIHVFEETFWISGRVGAKGCIWVLDSKFETIGEITKHDAEVYMCQDIGPLIWSVSWDKKIYTWRPNDLKFLGQVENFHTDAIQAVFRVNRVEGDGWIVWTGSSDSTINVLFVPKGYAQALLEDDDATPIVPIVLPPEKTAPKEFLTSTDHTWNWKKSPRQAERRKSQLGRTRTNDGPKLFLSSDTRTSRGSSPHTSPRASESDPESRARPPKPDSEAPFKQPRSRSRSPEVKLTRSRSSSGPKDKEKKEKKEKDEKNPERKD